MVRPPVLDGVLDAAEWDRTALGEGFTDKDTGLVSDEKGEFWLAYDEKFVYFAARATTDPKKVVADEYRQNVSLEGNDAFILMVDGQRSGQDSDRFSMNAQGATSLDLSGGRAAKTEWLGEFEAVGKRTETGWQVEARIPWSLIRIPPAGRHDLVFNVLWFRTNKSNTYEWTYTKSDFKNFPLWTGIDVPTVKNDRAVQVLPYFYGGIDHDRTVVGNAGVDLKTELNDDLTLVGTVNPDFRNIENNVLSLDHSYFERLADDARPFFQEGSGFRSFGFDQRIFASQRIRDFDTGVNLYGKLSPATQLAVLSTLDFGNQLAFATSIGHRFDATKTFNFGYVRNEQPGARNDSVNLFYDQRSGDYDFYASLQGTDDAVFKSGTRFNTGVFRQNGGVSASFEYFEVSPDFHPRLGFSPEQDLRGVYGNYGQEVQRPLGFLSEYSFELNGNYVTRMDGRRYRNEVGGEFVGKIGQKLAMGLSGSVSEFEGSHDHVVTFEAVSPSNNPYRNAAVGVTVGRFDGDPYRSYALRVNYKPTARMQVGSRMQWVDYRGFDRQWVLSANYDIGRYEAFGGRLVRQGDDWNWYLSYRLSGRRGSEFFVILGDPNAPEFRRSLIIKAIVPVTLKL
ncbi:MAG: hypothetical protein JST30_15185 [Armatimonadetes bacterium]|nr:hypothetical protein [Armatimonadota bacterium]